jgi:plastocyanin
MLRLAGVALVFGFWLLPSGAHAQESSSVTIKNIAFDPATVHVSVGGTVTWTNDDSVSHSVTADDGSFDSNPSCHLDLLGEPVGCMTQGQTFPHSFFNAGSFAYHCRIHDNMQGTVVVDPVTSTSSEGTTTTSSTTTTSTPPTASTDTTLPGSSGELPTVTQGQPPNIGGPTTGATRQISIRAKDNSSEGPLALVAVGIAGGTTIAGIVLVRKGRVPFG